jgi:pimeloyl-ACP methyl ester carboxylesterase
MTILYRLLIGTVLLLVGWSQAAAQNVHIIEWSRGKSPIAIVFIHGLGGCAVPLGQTAAQACAVGAIDSFHNTQARQSWPEMVAGDPYELAQAALGNLLLMPMKLGDFGVFGIDYSRLTTSDCPNFSIPQAARLIRGKLESSDIYKRYEQVIFVAHSMGGLITKNILISWQDSGDPEGRLARTIGIFLLGVPSQGTNIAPGPGVRNYIAKVLHADVLLNACGRQIDDLFAGQGNTYLFDLERRWEDVLGARRAHSQSQAPLVFCAYETKPEPIVPRVFSQTIVDALYTQTQCSEGQVGIGTFHTDLPKPKNMQDDVHRAWLTPSLDRLFTQWAKWEFARFDTATDENVASLAAWINQHQRAFTLKVDEVRDVKLGPDRLVGPNQFGLAATLVRKNPALCMESVWPDGGPGTVMIRPAGKCSH